MYQSVMKTVSGPGQLCRAKVIQTMTETPGMVLCHMKRQDIMFCVMSYYAASVREENDKIKSV